MTEIRSASAAPGAEIIRADGHTIGHILWYFPEAKALFTGDTLFNLCIGGLFEGSAEQMFATLNKIKELPNDVKFYPGHEYTIHGIGFAQYFNPNSQLLKQYVEEANGKIKRKTGRTGNPRSGKNTAILIFRPSPLPV